MATPMLPANFTFTSRTRWQTACRWTTLLVITPYPVQPGSVIRARAVGVLNMEDEAGGDAKLVAVPHEKLTQMYNNVNDIDDVPQLLRDQIAHFFENYKDLEKGKWVKVQGWGNAEEARGMIVKAAEAEAAKKG